MKNYQMWFLISSMYGAANVSGGYALALQVASLVCFAIYYFAERAK